MIAADAVQKILKKGYGQKTGNHGVLFYSGILTLASAVLFLFMVNFKISFSLNMLLYAVGIAAAHFLSVVFTHLSLVSGPLSTTSLVTSFSMVIPTAFGIIAYRERLTVAFVIGFAILVTSLFLINSKKANETVTAKWAVFVILSVVGAGLYSVIQSLYQRVINDGTEHGMLSLGFFISALLIFVVSAAKEYKEVGKCIKSAMLRAPLTGFINAGANFVVLILMQLMNLSLIYPLFYAGTIVASTVISITLYKEKLSVRQGIGLILGTLAIIFISV